MMSDTTDVQTVMLDGKRFVILLEADYRRLVSARVGVELPPADGAGNRPAVEAMRAVMARDIVRDRQRLGWSQAELARRAGIRVETLNRIEGGKHTPSVPTVQKIDAAFQAAEPKLPIRKAKKRKA